MERKLWNLVERGKLEDTKEILRIHPAINVNWSNGFWKGPGGPSSALHRACWNGHDAIVSLLLAHPAINVNLKDTHGFSPFMIAARCGALPCVRLLLLDPRVRPNEPGGNGYTPLIYSVFYVQYDVIRWWIASGREMDLGKPGDEKTDAIRAAVGLPGARKTEMVTLLERFRGDPVETRRDVRVELGCEDDLAAEIFALVIFVSDGLLEIRRKISRKTCLPNRARVFAIATRLPIELQMVLCYRMVGSAREIIPFKESELAFRELAKRI